MAATKVMPSPSHAGARPRAALCADPWGAGPSLSRSAGEGLLSGASESPSPALRERGDPARRAGWVRVSERHSILGSKDRAAVDERAPHPALHRASVKRRILRFRAEIVGRDAPG
jgi:hypothetical protein